LGGDPSVASDVLTLPFDGVREAKSFASSTVCVLATHTPFAFRLPYTLGSRLRAALLHEPSRNSEVRIPEEHEALGSTAEEANPATAGIAQVITMLSPYHSSFLTGKSALLCSTLQIELANHKLRFRL
jgi:hypothetical protein